MVKTAMKREKTRPQHVQNLGLLNSLNARQFGLKLLANVSYGYTAAGFSGRMPCAELADSIVSTGPNNPNNPSNSLSLSLVANHDPMNLVICIYIYIAVVYVMWEWAC